MGVAALLFQIIAGVCAALLTLARPFMKNDNRRHLTAHTVVGIIAMVSLILAGVLSFLSQKNVANELEDLTISVRDLGNKVGANENNDPRQALTWIGRKINALERKSGPRILSNADMGDIANRLSAYGHEKFFVAALSQSREDVNFATQIMQTLLLAGWQGSVGVNFEPGVDGIVIAKKVERAHPDIAKALEEELSSRGFEINEDLSGNSFSSPDTIEIKVGPKY